MRWLCFVLLLFCGLSFSAEPVAIPNPNASSFTQRFQARSVHPQNSTAFATYKTQSNSELKSRSFAVEAKIDKILNDVTNQIILPSVAIQKLTDPQLIQELGLIFIFFEPAAILTGIATQENYLVWQRTINGGFMPPNDATDFFAKINGTQPQAGAVTVALPIIKNGYDFDHPLNREIAFESIRVTAEELYHGVQYARSNGKVTMGNQLISKHFENLRGSKFKALERKLFSDYALKEVDVYLKLLEVMGSEFVPAFYGGIDDQGYPERSYVDRTWFEPANCDFDLKSL